MHAVSWPACAVQSPYVGWHEMPPVVLYGLPPSASRQKPDPSSVKQPTRGWGGGGDCGVPAGTSGGGGGAPSGGDGGGGGGGDGGGGDASSSVADGPPPPSSGTMCAASACSAA